MTTVEFLQTTKKKQYIIANIFLQIKIISCFLRRRQTTLSRVITSINTRMSHSTKNIHH